MKAYVLISLLFLGFCLQSYGQFNPWELDSLQMDSLKRKLPSLQGTARVDCMIRMCLHYDQYAPVLRINAADSLHFYARQVLLESRRINYKKGIAMGLVDSAPDSSKEKFLREAILIGHEINNEEVQGWGELALSSGNITPDATQALNYLLSAINHFHKSDMPIFEATTCNWVSQSYMGNGDYEKAYDYAKRSTEILKPITRPEYPYAYLNAQLWDFWGMSQLYSAAGDYETALAYMRQTNELNKQRDPLDNPGGFSIDIAGIFMNMGQYDSSLLYWSRARNSYRWAEGWPPGKALATNGFADILIATGQFDKGIEILTQNIAYFDSLRLHTSGNWKHAGYYGKMTASKSLSKAYFGIKDYASALHFARQSTDLTKIENRRPEMMEGYQLLSTIYHQLRNNDSAYEYLIKYQTIKDSIQNKQFLLRIYNTKINAEFDKKQAELLLLDRDNKLQGERLKYESRQKDILLMVIAAILLTGLFIYRNVSLKRKNERLKLENDLTVQRLESEKRHAELKREASELQMRTLQAQMNPHFIFNSLSSINWFILENEKDIASQYLTRFSRLMRMVLNAQKPMIPLEDELKMLELYLDLERLRFSDSFDYSISYSNTLEPGTVSIPPMLLQPFCENAIWHGFLNKKEPGRLLIDINMKDNMLECSITDNGVGRKQAAALKSRSPHDQKSFGLEIIRDRLALFSQEYHSIAHFAVEDLIDEHGRSTGTKVLLTISYADEIEKVA